jgi:hypothetical protein
MTAPFDYPPAAHVRRHGPKGYTKYTQFRSWLRDEFSFRCVYCLVRERWGRVKGIFEIDHFLSKKHYPAYRNDYDNLLYTCATCNGAKLKRQVPNPLIVLTSGVVDVAEDGAIRTDDPDASRLIEALALNSPTSVEYRRLLIGTVVMAAKVDPDLYGQYMGYPDVLPNLRRARPPWWQLPS